MRFFVLMLLAMGVLFVSDAKAQQSGAPAQSAPALPSSIYQVPIEPMSIATAGTTTSAHSLAPFKGKVMLILNVASYCGNTPQYQGLEALYQKYRGQGLELVGFPSNDFGSQEPGSEKEIVDFCTKNYSVTFPLFAKVHALAKPEPAPIYQYLLANIPPTAFKGPVQWNFEKFLVSRDGKIVGRFRNRMKPDDPELVKAIEAELAKPAPAATKTTASN